MADVERPDVEGIKAYMEQNIKERLPRNPEPGFAMWTKPLDVIALCDYILDIENVRTGNYTIRELEAGR